MNEVSCEATALLQYEPLMIPGLLQTPEYARAVIEATGSGLSEDEVDALVASRISRQSVLTKRQSLQLHVLVEEDALNRPFGDAGVLARQLRHLADIATRPNIILQLLPTETGLRAGLHGAFVVLEYDDEPSLVWLENQLASVFLEEDEQIEGYLASWNDMVARARTADESAELICKMVV
ncbi:DUF5753 domain-containing protein [Saccharopolyspora pogona]|uniref:DUF5753 domain-containing protein n=1 Tax=Saccharopolyspora pogona TaxID=333966 RepID=UPI001686B31E|nr:DUF5753 domain-containing protein [Saccharopolyspora pogona]